MSTILRRPVWSVTVDDEHGDPLTLGAPRMSVGLDSGAVPYGSAQVDVPLVATDTIEALDPRDGVRAVVSIGGDGEAPRLLDLGLSRRVVDHKARTIALVLETDEALLQRYKPLADLYTPYSYQSSIRALVNHVLGVAIPGAALAAGGPDAAIRAITSSVNLVRNPRAKSDLSDWASSNSMSRVASGGPAGCPTYVNVMSASAGTLLVAHSQEGVPIQGGKRYRISVYQNTTAGTPTGIDGVVMNAAGGIVADLPEVSQPAPAGWFRRTIEFVAPATATKVQIRSFTTAAVPAGTSLNTTGWRVSEVTEDPTDTGYYDGDTAPTTDYGYAYSGSTSVRTALASRASDMLVWRAGRSAWEFLEALCAVAGLRLYCDELRVWRLIDPATFTAPTLLSLSPLVSVEGTDTIDASDPQTYCTGVVIRYSWIDPSGQARTAIDSAGVAGQVLTIDLDRAYPGPGIAAAVLARRQGQGRSQDITALATWDANPGQSATISLPGTITQAGRVTSIDWTLPAALMRVGTVGLTDIIPGSIAALGGTIDALPGTIDSL